MAIYRYEIVLKRLRALIPGLAAVWWAVPGSAATTIEFAVTDAGSGAARMQTAYVKDGDIYVKNAGGDANLDLLFSSSDASVALINHSDRSYLHLDEKKVSELADSAHGMMSMVQRQLTENLANLPPEQAARVKEMMGRFGLPTEAPPPEPKPKLVRRGTRNVNNFACQQIDVVSDQGKLAQLCVASAAALNIPESDYATIQAIKAFAEKLDRSASKIRGRLGGSVPNVFGLEVEGVPVEMRDVSGATPSSMTVTRVARGVGNAILAIPNGYHPKTLPSLPNM